MARRSFEDPEREAARLAALEHIRQYGDPVLRTPAERIEVFDEALVAEAHEMVRLMDDGRGVGLAAPQVGRLRRLIVIQPFEDQPAHALVNPEITWRSDEEDVAVEGCLSIGEVNVDVSRAVAIRVRAQDLNGTEFEAELEGFAARVVQHEVDHLDGVLILDRATPEDRRAALAELRESLLPSA
ncbi:MAG: peptide deformylase [Thermoleophilia bacterium]|nr:peptide deformylase [Thermoleophilia bacterium]